MPIQQEASWLFYLERKHDDKDLADFGDAVARFAQSDDVAGRQLYWYVPDHGQSDSFLLASTEQGLTDDDVDNLYNEHLEG